MKARLFFIILIFIVATNTISWFTASRQIHAHKIRMDIIEELYKRTEDRWTGTDDQDWVVEFQRLNPDIKVPAKKAHVEDVRVSPKQN